MDVEKRKWSNVKETMRHIVVQDVHYASVDTVLLVNVSMKYKTQYVLQQYLHI